MNKVKVVIVGAGNISNTRHIPALKKVDEMEVVGVLSNRVDRAEKTAKKNNIPNFAQIDMESKDGGLSNLDWFDRAEAVVIGAPPKQHYALVKMALMHNKHVLVEKPMMMDRGEADELIKLAQKKKKIFYVMHNFQYADKMLKLNEIIESRKYGEIESITEVQFTNHDRRLPEWYNDLPMGLFYDEAAHFVYLLERHAGALSIDNSYAVYDKKETENTPVTLTVNAVAGKVPVTMLLNFRSPVCEWYYIVNFNKQIFVYDFFKDILVSLPTDNEHRASDILSSSIRYTFQYWYQFITNGVKMVTGNLLYGHDTVMRKYADAISNGNIDEFLDASNGRKNTVSINEIVTKANIRKRV